MADFFSGLAQGLSGLPNAMNQVHEERELGREADAYFPYVQDKLSDETRQRWGQMSGKEKLAKIKAWQFSQEQDLLKKHQALEDKKNDYFFRNANVEYNLNQNKLRKELNPPVLPQLGSKVGPGTVTSVPGQGSIQLPPAAPAQKIGGGRVDIDPVTGQPKYDLQQGVYYSGGQPFLLSDQQAKALQAAEDARKASAQGTNIPGVTDINKQLADETGKLAAGGTGRYTIFPGVTVGTPRQDVIKGLQAKKDALMKLYGTPAAPAAAGGPGGAPVPAAAPTAPPTGGAAPAGKVRVISPTGQSGLIPAEQLDTYIKSGYRQVSGGQDVMAGMEQFMA